MFTKSGYGPTLGIAVVAAGASIAALTGVPAAHAASGTAHRTPACTHSQLRISYTDNGQIREGALAGMSKTDNVVTFKNVSRTTCVIEGFPGVAALNSHGTQVRQAVRTTSIAPGDSKVRPVYLNRDGVASALVAANTASCNSPTYVPGLLVTAPGTYHSVRLGPAGYMCLHSLTVSPVVPGNAAGFVF
jgi:Protein of unknown function (DUF4232)